MPRSITIIVALLWLVISLVGSGVLVTRSFDATSSEHLVGQAQHLAGVVAERVQNAPENAAASNPSPVSLSDTEDPASFQEDLDGAVRLDPTIAYAMLWAEDGEVIAHTRRKGIGHYYLDVNKWPALDSQQALRISHLSVPEWTGGGDGQVTEVTVPVKLGGKTVGYLSVAHPDSVLTGEFWGTQKGLMAGAAVFSVAGLGVILGIMRLTALRFERSRREILQTARARTSLLTERGMLASVLAHEIRSPLTALRFNLHSLRQLVSASDGEGEGGKQAELTDRCEREIRRLDNMLTDFLHHTQVIGAANVEPTALNAVINEAMEFLRPALDRAGIHVSLHLDPANPRVSVHPDELRQVILNLTANAQDAMQNLPAQKRKTLAISTIADESAGATIPTATLLIRDSGAGISADVRDRIFDPFFSTKPNGSGLGLTLVRRVVSGAGGTVLYESSEQNAGGTTFRVVFPRGGEGNELTTENTEGTEDGGRRGR